MAQYCSGVNDSGLYLRNKRLRVYGGNKTMSKFVFAVLFFVIAIGAIFGGTVGMSYARSVEERPANAFNVVKFFACSVFDKDSPQRAVYQVTQTDDLYYAVQSRSAVTGGTSDINSGLNWFLTATGADFNKVNTEILGQEVESGGTSLRDTNKKSAEELKENWNKNPVKYSAYDRFGMSGTTFTSYNGEWKYMILDACKDESEGSQTDAHIGAFYENRLEPLSTWSDRSDSKDPRVAQNIKSETTRYAFGFATLIANIIFLVTKFIVTLTISFISFSFTDIVHTMGIDGVLTDGTSTGGIFGSLFTSIFKPFIVIIAAFTGMHIFYIYIKNRQFREGLSKALVTLLMFVVAVVVSINPAPFLSFPNKASVAVQAVVVQAFSGTLSGGDGVCSTDIGIKDIDVQSGTSGKEDQDYLDKVTQNMSSLIGCSFWNTFVFKPWVEGQWGTTWNETWAKDKIPDWAPKGATALSNSDKNAEMVGDATVPLGNGAVINNWALFNLSANTNAHSQVGKEGQIPEYTQGVSKDWWRIVDALSNYEEVDGVSTVNVDKTKQSEEIKAPEVKENPVMTSWNDWVGNNPDNRVSTALSSLFIGAVGLLAPFAFGLMAVVYSVAMSIVMVFLPIMLLFGCWSGRGFNIFKQWVVLLWNLFTKRVAVGIMLMMTIIFVNAAINVMKNVGWWHGAIILVILTLGLFKSRHKIMNILSSNNAGAFASTASSVGRRISSVSKSVGNMSLSTANGAVYAKTHGGTLRDGAKVGLKSELSNMSYRIPVMNEYRMAKNQVDIEKNGANSIVKNRFCAGCESMFSDNDRVTQGKDGGWYCESCAEGDPTLMGGYEIVYKTEPKKDSVKPKHVKSIDSGKDGGKINRIMGDSKLGNRKHWQSSVNSRTGKVTHTLDAKTFIKYSSSVVRKDTVEIVQKVRDGDLDESSLLGDNIPAEIQPYLDAGMMKILVQKQDWEAVAQAIIAAYSIKITETLTDKVGKDISKYQADLDKALKVNQAYVQKNV